MTNEILLEIQHNFPLVERPFEAIAQKFDITEDEVIAILQEQKDAGIIRQTSAIFDTKKLGYKSSLVAFKVDESDIDTAVSFINAHPGISHNYLRSHPFNVWFTIAIAPNSKIGLEKTVEFLAKKANAKEFLILPTLKMFKISVKLDTTKSLAKKEKVVQKEHKALALNEEHYKIVELLQKDIKFEKEPFKFIVDALGVSYERLFELANEMSESGVLRRFASILNHKKAGFNSNAMVVWQIDEANSHEIGQNAAAFSAVSHCYLRPSYPNWPYNLFTMIHASSEEELNETISSMQKELPYEKTMILHSIQEFKKVRVVYFSKEFDRYEKEVLDEIS